jgi:hypothetical protein
MILLDFESEYLSAESPDFSVPVNIQSNWTSQLHLDALSHSVEHDGIISVNTTEAVIRRYNTVNNVHVLYQFDLATVQDIIGLQQDS